MSQVCIFAASGALVANGWRSDRKNFGDSAYRGWFYKMDCFVIF